MVAGTVGSWFGAPVVVGRWGIVLFWVMAASLILLGFRRTLGAVSAPPWLNYCIDEFLGVDCRWSYIGHSIAESTIAPFCPGCACRMIVGGTGSYAAAPETLIRYDECSYSQTINGQPMDVRDRVARLIERAVNTGAWK